MHGGTARVRRGRNAGGPRRALTTLTGVALAVATVAALAAAPGGPGLGGPGAGAATLSPSEAGHCHQPGATAHVTAVPVAGSASDWDVTSFDGTVIRAHWFPRGGSGRVPTVVMGPGWGSAGDTDTSSSDQLGTTSIKDLWAAGYNVLTWDPRGFGHSGGRAEVDSPAYEARDVSTLVTWLATRPGVQLDGRGDPRMGMIGGSYGGGIQLVTAATDCRVDVIVPTIAWHSLVTSLDKADTPKTGWAGLLTAAAAGAHLAPMVTRADVSSQGSGVITPAERAWFAARGPGALVGRIRVPTLLVQGTVDTLFTLQEGVDNEQALRAAGVPVHMIWYCGGHGVCLTPPGDQALPQRATLAWLARYLKGDRSVATGPAFTFVDQRGTEYEAAGWPLRAGPPVTAQGQGSLHLVSNGGSGPADVAGVDQELAAVAGGITPAPATNALDVPITFGDHRTVVVGAPRLTLTYRGTVPAGSRPTRLFAQLVDPSTGDVLGNQVTPVDVVLDGHTHTTSVPLEMVAFTGLPRQRIELQLVATTVAYATPRLGGSVELRSVHVTLPTVTHVTVEQGAGTAPSTTAPTTTPSAAG